MQTNNINGITINPNNNPFLYNSILFLGSSFTPILEAYAILLFELAKFSMLDKFLL